MTTEKDFQLMTSRYSNEYIAFQDYIKGERISVSRAFRLVLSIIPDTIEGLIRNIPGLLGILIRRFYYKFRLSHLGYKTIIDVGVRFIGPKNISIGDYCWIDSDTKFEARLGTITIGSRVHIASFVIMGAREPITICDFAAVAAGVKLYSNSVIPRDGLRMSGPMIPEEQKAFYSKEVIVGKDAVVGANSVLLPGALLQTGSILGALSLLKSEIPEWEIWAGSPAKKIGKREKVQI